MRQKMRWLAAVAGLLVMAGAVQAQQRIGSTGSFGGSSSSGGFGGSSSSGGFSGSGTFSGGSSSSGGFSGGSSSSSFTGSGTFSGGLSSSGFIGSSGTGGRGSSGSSTYGQTSPFGRFYGNPMAMGYSTTGSGSSGSSPATQSIRSYPETLSFGNPLVNQSTLSRSGQQLGTTSTLGGYGTNNLGSSSLSQSRVTGGSSMGTRRSPSYLTSMAFDGSQQPPPQQPPQGQPQQGQPQQGQTRGVNIPQPVIVVTPLQQAELQGTITRSARLPSRADIAVSTTDEGTVVLRGNVSSEREKRLAETMMHMKPGVGEVRNELQRRRKSP